MYFLILLVHSSQIGAYFRIIKYFQEHAFVRDMLSKRLFSDFF